MGLDAAECLEKLKGAGLSVESEEQTILDIARKNGLSPKQVYDIIEPSGSTDTKGGGTGLRSGAGAGAGNGGRNSEGYQRRGLGRMTLSEVCAERGIDVSAAIETLAGKGIKARARQTLREIASQNAVAVPDVWRVLSDLQAARKAR